MRTRGAASRRFMRHFFSKCDYGAGRVVILIPVNPIIEGGGDISIYVMMFNIVFNVTSRAPGLTSGLQGSVNVHRGALLLVPQ